LFRPDAFDTQTNPYAPYTVADFERLWTLVGDDAPLCVFDAPETTVRELHVLKTKHGMERARREGRLPGRRTGVSDRIFQLVVNDHYVGLSPRQICERYGVPRTTVRRLIASLDL
jgi:DNA invertase Pin-like site-specific DNA recombinase